MLYDKFENSFSHVIARLENIQGEPATLDNKSNEIRSRIAAIERQIDKFKSALEAIDDPSQATSLAGMLTNYDIKRSNLIKELELAVINEKGNKSFTKADCDFIKALYGKENKIKNPETRKIIQETLRSVIHRITIDVKQQSYTVVLKNNLDAVYTVSLLPNGYNVSYNGEYVPANVNLD